MGSLEAFFDTARPDDLLLLHMPLHDWKDPPPSHADPRQETAGRHSPSTSVEARTGLPNRLRTGRSLGQNLVHFDSSYNARAERDMGAGKPQSRKLAHFCRHLSAISTNPYGTRHRTAGNGR